MTGSEKLEFSARPEALEQVSRWIRDVGARHGLPDQTVGELDVILEELVMNVVTHAVPAPPAEPPVPVRIGAEVADGIVDLRVADKSLPFDPMSRPAPDVSLDIDHRPIGGLGIHLVKQLSNSFHYTYDQGWNVSHIRVSIHRENEA